MRYFAVLFLLSALPTVLAVPLSLRKYTVLSRSKYPKYSRQVGNGVSGNQTNNNGSTGGTDLGDGNAVGFAGTGNDIDTGDDFDIGDGNTTMGDGNRIEIGDRITNINLPLNMSEMMAEGIAQGVRGSQDGSIDVNVEVSMHIRIGNGNEIVGDPNRNSSVSVKKRRRPSRAESLARDAQIRE